MKKTPHELQTPLMMLAVSGIMAIVSAMLMTPLPDMIDDAPPVLEVSQEGGSKPEAAETNPVVEPVPEAHAGCIELDSTQTLTLVRPGFVPEVIQGIHYKLGEDGHLAEFYVSAPVQGGEDFRRFCVRQDETLQVTSILSDAMNYTVSVSVDGEPLADTPIGIRVASDFAWQTRSTETDENGCVTFLGLCPGRAVVTGGFLPVLLEIDPDETELVVELVSDVVRGEVVDMDDEPLPCASLWFTNLKAPNPWAAVRLEADDRARFSLAAARGNYELAPFCEGYESEGFETVIFDGLEPAERLEISLSRVSEEVTHPGSLRRWWSREQLAAWRALYPAAPMAQMPGFALAEYGSFDSELIPAGIVAVSVVDETGDAIQDARILMSEHPLMKGFDPLAGTGWVRSDHRGTALTPWLEPGTYEIGVSKLGYRQETVQVELTAEFRHVTVTLHRN